MSCVSAWASTRASSEGAMRAVVEALPPRTKRALPASSSGVVRSAASTGRAMPSGTS